MNDLLLELYSEEMPHVAQSLAQTSFKELFTAFFIKNNIKFQQIEVFSGPCRITIDASELSFASVDQVIRGPKKGSDQSILEAFCSKHHLQLADLKLQSENGSECYILHKKNTDTLESLLMDGLPRILASHVWPKCMKWGDYSISWIRPLKNILCLLGGKILPIQYGHLTANDLTFGHKFFFGQSMQARSFDAYKKLLRENCVILAKQERKQIIMEQIATLQQSNNILLNSDEKLLDEVSALVEWPVALLGSIPEKFMALPKELLISCLKVHQKYFTCSNLDGSMASKFIFVCNSPIEDFSQIIAGNEKVLNARLSDALYFYEQDLKMPLASRFDDLDKVIFHSKLGTMRDKALRLVKICAHLQPNDAELQMAARLCKCDLVSNVVGEFPELQGLISRYYAKNDGLSASARDAIVQHYGPQGANDEIPQLPAAYLSLADRLDSFVGLMLAGERATSSKDPYALRRNAISILRIILERDIKIDLGEAIKFIAQLFEIQASAELFEEMEIFMVDRLKNLLSKSFDAKILNAALSNNLTDVRKQVESAKQLAEFCKTQEWESLIFAYKRMVNILSKKTDFSKTKVALFQTSFEHSLFDLMSNISPILNNNYLIEGLRGLLPLVEGIEKLFENVMVNDDDKNIALNRQNLINEVKTCFDRAANFHSFL